MLLLLASVVSGCFGSPFELDSLDALLLPRRRSEDPGLKQSFFPNLMNVEINATRTSESQYPWIARVVHSTKHYYPHMCTASCVHFRVFMTSAGCVYNLKVEYTSVVFQRTMFPALSFVISNTTTKQLFDDIGLIVVTNSDYEGDWPTIDFENGYRKGEGFRWFAEWKMGYGPAEYKVVGYATDKSLKENLAIVEYYLTELDVTVNINLCATILSVNNIKGFYVPCYHSCTLQEFKMKNKKCEKFHGVEGGALIDVKAKKLIGVATWSAGTRRHILPVGFAVPNSDDFFQNYECALSILNDTSTLFRRGLQSVCHY